MQTKPNGQQAMIRSHICDFGSGRDKGGHGFQPRPNDLFIHQYQ